MPEAPVLVAAYDGVLVITLDRPEVRNAVELPLVRGVAAALDQKSTFPIPKWGNSRPTP
jgi:enoyl-CoA hydratase/carnithine racemase